MAEPRALRVGSRGSELALWQARFVIARIAAIPDTPPCEIVIVETSGDRLADVALSQVSGKAFFTREIEVALLDGKIDLAVHSLKDLATEIPEGLAIAAVLARDDPRDALIVAGGADGADGAALTIDDLPRAARVGTSSLRRRAMVLRRRPDLEIADLRGNVPTRLEKLDRGEFDAIVLAAAGLLRLGLESRIAARLPLDPFLPAAGQGAIAVQIRTEDEEAAGWSRALDDAPTRAATSAERALLARLEGGCQIPLGVLATVDADRLTLAAAVSSLDGSDVVEGSLAGALADAAPLGRALAEELLLRGADRILAGIRKR